MEAHFLSLAVGLLIFLTECTQLDRIDIKKGMQELLRIQTWATAVQGGALVSSATSVPYFLFILVT